MRKFMKVFSALCIIVGLMVSAFYSGIWYANHNAEPEVKEDIVTPITSTEFKAEYLASLSYYENGVFYQVKQIMIRDNDGNDEKRFLKATTKTPDWENPEEKQYALILVQDVLEKLEKCSRAEIGVRYTNLAGTIVEDLSDNYSNYCVLRYYDTDGNVVQKGYTLIKESERNRIRAMISGL